MFLEEKSMILKTPGLCFQNSWGFASKPVGFYCKTPGVLFQKSWGFARWSCGFWKTVLCRFFFSSGILFCSPSIYHQQMIYSSSLYVYARTRDLLYCAGIQLLACLRPRFFCSFFAIFRSFLRDFLQFSLNF